MSANFYSKPQMFQNLVQKHDSSDEDGVLAQGANKIFSRLSFRPTQFGAAVAVNQRAERRSKLARKVRNDLRSELMDLEPLAKLSNKGQ